MEETEFEKFGKPEIPLLDDTTPHPLDKILSIQTREVVAIIEGSRARFCALVTRLSHTIVNICQARLDIGFFLTDMVNRNYPESVL